MILLTKAAVNTITLTLSEKCDLLVPVFLFRFRNEQSQRDFGVILNDLSTYTSRYNRFQFTEGESTTLTFEPGFWLYEVYEQTSTTNTDWMDSGCNLVEQGKMKVEASTTTTNTTYTGEDNTRIVYEG